MPGSSHPILPFTLDRFSEITRRQLYDTLRQNLFFIPGAPYQKEEPLPYTAEGAHLEVHYKWGRWIAVWTRCEVPRDRPEAERIEVLRIKPSDENDLGIMLHEC